MHYTYMPPIPPCPSLSYNDSANHSHSPRLAMLYLYHTVAWKLLYGCTVCWVNTHVSFIPHLSHPYNTDAHWLLAHLLLNPLSLVSNCRRCVGTLITLACSMPLSLPLHIKHLGYLA